MSGAVVPTLTATTIISDTEMRNELRHLLDTWALDIPFERAVRLNAIVLKSLQETGLTWSSIADALTRAGARHKTGRPISTRQLNTVFLRVTKRTLVIDAPHHFPPANGNNRPVSAARAKLAGIQTKPRTITATNVVITAKVNPAPVRTEGLVRLLSEARRMYDATRAEYDE